MLLASCVVVVVVVVLADAGWAQGPRAHPFFDHPGHGGKSFCIGIFVKALIFLNSSLQFWRMKSTAGRQSSYIQIRKRGAKQHKKTGRQTSYIEIK